MTSPYEKVEWETKRLERRIAEARMLAEEGKLTDEVQEAVAEAVKGHSDAAQQGIAELHQTDDGKSLSPAVLVQIRHCHFHERDSKNCGKPAGNFAQTMPTIRPPFRLATAKNQSPVAGTVLRIRKTR